MPLLVKLNHLYKQIAVGGDYYPSKYQSMLTVAYSKSYP